MAIFESAEEWEAELSQFSDTYKNSDPPEDVVDCLRDDTWRQILAYYANENHVTENVEFLAALLPYRDSGSMDMGEGKLIYERFVKAGSPQEVNISGPQRDELKEIYESDEPIAPPNHYDAAFDEIKRMCNFDTYRRFKDAAKKVRAELSN